MFESIQTSLNHYFDRVERGFYVFGKYSLYFLLGLVVLIASPLWVSVFIVTFPFWWVGGSK